MEQIFSFLYEKDGQYTVLSLNDAKEQEKSLLKEGWNHVATLDTLAWVNYQFNHMTTEIMDKVNERADQFILSFQNGLKPTLVISVSELEQILKEYFK